MIMSTMLQILKERKKRNKTRDSMKDWSSKADDDEEEEEKQQQQQQDIYIHTYIPRTHIWKTLHQCRYKSLLFHPAWWQKFLDQNSLDKIFPKETTIQNKTKQRKEICEEERSSRKMHKCLQGKKKHTHIHTHTHTQLKDQSKVAQLIQLELGC